MDTELILVTEDQYNVVEVGSTFVVGASGSTAGVFILDVTAAGVVAGKTFETHALQSCQTDTADITVLVGCEGDSTLYTPSVTVNGINTPLTETSTKRWFNGSANVTLSPGDNTITAMSSTGSVHQAIVTLLGAGPAISSIVWGSYPGTQTELRAGDSISFTAYTAPEAVEVSLTGGSVVSGGVFPAVGGVATGTMTAGAGTGSLTVVARARNAFGTQGAAFETPALVLNQTVPSFSAVSVTYPGGQAALGVNDTATVSCTVTNASSVSYAVVGMTVDDQNYAVSKTVTNTSTGYVASGTNYTITATRAANGAVAATSALVKIATTPPTGAITAAARMISSPAGTDHEVRIYPSQELMLAPSLTASIGTWQGAWVQMAGYWRRYLRITDTDAKGAGTFSALSLTGLAFVSGTGIISGASFTSGGMTSRTVTFPAFSRVASLGTSVVDRTKTTAVIVGGNTLTRYDNNASHANGYYIANADGTYNPSGSYVGLSDTAFAGSNTTGGLQVTFEEVA